MGVGSPGAEQFRNAIVKMRNLHIFAGISPLMLFREEVVTNDELSNRMGTDDSSRTHFLSLLNNADKWRRRVTHNPDGLPMGDKIAKAINPNDNIEDAENPFGGDDIQMGSGGLRDLPWPLDGTDPDIPLNSALKINSNNALLLLGAIDVAIVSWTRLNSRDRTRFITHKDSFRIYGLYQEILGYLNSFAGNKNQIDVSGTRASDEPRGPDNSPNRKTESVGDSQKGG